MTSAPLVPVMTSALTVPIIVQPRRLVWTSMPSLSALLPEFGSNEPDTVTCDWLVCSPETVGRQTTTMRSVVPDAMEGLEQDNEPVSPTGGVVHEYAAGGLTDLNLNDDGASSTAMTESAVLRPKL